jgi:hypothetical protein
MTRPSCIEFSGALNHIASRENYGACLKIDKEAYLLEIPFKQLRSTRA